MYLKIHQNPNGKVVAVCDRELIGKVIEEGQRCLDLERYRSFYVGEISDREKVEGSLREFQSANLVGQRCVRIAVDMGLAEEDDIMYIKETPYIQIYKI